ncbi:MAG: ABC transporter ATP-binding protein [Thermoanaerobaculales bacterium]|nr:ABC transporter ATP-binding protein [Thermoanaerobaculales bacterium]
MTHAAPVIEVEELSFSYDGHHPTLENVNFTLAAGDFASIIGPNGGGKTTLLKLILGMLKPRSGRVRVFGESPDRVLSRIGTMPQHTVIDSQFPIRVIDVVLMGCLRPGRKLGAFSRADRQAARDALERVGLLGLEHRAYSALSGGQRQRVLLARAIAPNPDLLMLDEPEAGLDRKIEQDFFDLLEELNRDTTVVLVSHDLGFVASFVRTVICVHTTVDVHPTSHLDGTMIQDLYGGEVQVVHHDRHL